MVIRSLETARLRLRVWRQSDRELFAALNADAEAMRFFPKPLTRSESDGMAEYVDRKLQEWGYGLWALEIKGEDRFIGFTGLSHPRFQAHFTPCTEIGWRLAREHWGQGYATEAARAVLDDAFVRLGLTEVVAFTSQDNERSRKVMTRLGMTQELDGDFDHPEIAEDHPLRHHVLYRLTALAWESQF